MEKKKYTKPTIVKVELNHEQAVLGTCSSSADKPDDGGASTCYGVHGTCKTGQTGYTGDSNAIS